MRRKDLEPGRARRDEHREGVRRRGLLLAERDRRLVAVVAVGDQQRHVQLDVARRAAARRACARRPPRPPARDRRQAARPAARRRRSGRSARAACCVARSTRQAALLRARVSSLVRQHLALRVRRRLDRAGEALAAPRDAVRADVVLRRSTTTPAPLRGERPAGATRQGRCRPPPASREASGGRRCTGSGRGSSQTLGVVDHVVGRSDQALSAPATSTS